MTRLSLKLLTQLTDNLTVSHVLTFFEKKNNMVDSRKNIKGNSEVMSTKKNMSLGGL